MSIREPYTWDMVRHLGMETFFQPIYNVEKRRITGLEALIRVHNEKGGYIDAEELVGEAEDAGWVDKLDMWSLEQACVWIRKFMEYGITRINVNLAPATCIGSWIQDSIVNCLRRHDIPHDKIWLELTELGTAGGDGRLLEAVKGLQAEEFNFVMDDFGKGESNFLRLMDFEFQSIKLDKDLVKGMATKRMGLPIVNMLLQFTKQHHIYVTAEGIETPEQANLLSEMGCNFLQGYLISRPIPARECLELLKEWQNKDILDDRMRSA